MNTLPEVRDNSQRAQLTIALFWSIILTNIVSILLTKQAAAFPNAFSETATGFGTEEIWGIVATLLGLSQVAATFLGSVFFLQWFRRAYFNIREAGIRTQHTDGWAVGAWFIPFLNFVRPYTIMKEVWYGTLQMAGRYRGHTLLRWWWIAYLVHSVTINYESSSAANATDDNSAWALISTFFDIASAILTLIVVRYVHEAEQEASYRLQVGTLGQEEAKAQELLPTQEEY
ncbi:DUF4328 domain-containing protein [Hymenobacter lutimineralis]|uniref:DUF4328 domain-containing protein n=1 Tax=Hymenobacter lutimineralis TaxID=2606448 RepID=A0A5D6V5T7_9BACT|nr:DUF4328 domain-containing protein [Hymenobacter lutimineralis]TYZ10545.1 DUF4328 domain-containing protein [Hymenobacter lutimineralis]